MTSAVPKVTKAKNAITSQSRFESLFIASLSYGLIPLSAQSEMVQPGAANTSHRSRAYCHAEKATDAPFDPTGTMEGIVTETSVEAV